MGSHQYSKSTDFPNGLKEHQLEDDIQLGSFSVNYVDIDVVDDVVKINFDGNLTAGDITTLDNIVSAYVYEEDEFSNSLTIGLLKTKTLSSIFEIVGTTFYSGSFSMPPIGGIYITANMSEGATSYDLLLIEEATGNVIFNVNLNNTIPTLHKITTLNNIPKKSGVLELYARINGGSSDDLVSIETAKLVY